LVGTLNERFGRTGASLALTLVFMLLGMIYVRPVWDLNIQGITYGAMAAHPFDTGPKAAFPHRVLTPLLSYLIGLRGDNIMITNLLVAAFFLFFVIRYFNTPDREPIGALIAGTVFTFSMPTLGTFFNSGYCDSSLYVIILLMWLSRRRRFWFYLLFLLGLLNRESMAFLLPWFAYERYRSTDRSARHRVIELAIGFGVAMGVYGLFYLWMASRQEIILSPSYYLGPLTGNWRHWLGQSDHPWLGLFTVFKLLWAIPILALVYWWRTRRRSEVISIALLFVCTWLQLLVAYDSSRLFTQGFLVMIPALDLMLGNNLFQFRRRIGWLLAMSLFVPQWYTAANAVVVMKPWLEYLF